MTEPLRFAIVGSGMIAQVHARAVVELGDGARLRVVVGRNASTTAALAARYGAVATIRRPGAVPGRSTAAAPR